MANITYAEIIKAKWPNKIVIRTLDNTYNGIVWNQLDTTPNPTQAELDAAIAEFIAAASYISGQEAAGSAALTIPDSGIIPGTYTKLNIDIKGRATSGADIASIDVTNALGYIPALAGSGVGAGVVPSQYTFEAVSQITTSINNGVSVVPSMSVAPVHGTYLATFNCDCTSIPTSVTNSAASDLTTLYNYLHSLPDTNTTHGAAFGASEVLTAGVFSVPAAGSVAGTLILDGQNNPNALFVFKIGAAFTSSASAEIVLVNKASSANVFFVCEGAASTGANTIFRGTLMSNQAAASTGAGTTIEGRLLARLGAVSISGSTLTLPSQASIVQLGQVSVFSLFTAGGDISNAGASQIYGDIGTNLGSVTGFSTAEVRGTIYTPAVVNAESTFGVYKNGVLLDNSKRLRSTTSTVDIPLALQTIVSANDGDIIDVRGLVALGSMTIGPRIFTLTRVYDGVVDVSSGKVVAYITGTTSAMTGTSIIPFDNTAPLISEGSQLWAQTLTPIAASCRLTIDQTFMVDSNVANRNITVAIFRNNECIYVTSVNVATSSRPALLAVHCVDMPAVTTAIVYSARIGINIAGTWYLNQTSTATFGGNANQSDWSIMEIT